MQPPLTFWDIAAGILIGGALIMGMVWGARRGGDERPFFWICGALACFIVLWRGYVWHQADEAASIRAQTDKAALYAKYDLVPPEHQ